MREVVVASSAAVRLARAGEVLGEHGVAREVLIVGASHEAASRLVREVARGVPGTFGWQRRTLGSLAGALAAPALVAAKRVSASVLAIEAVCARVVFQLAHEGRLGRFEVIRDRPGLPRAIARTLREVRLAGLRPAELDSEHGELVEVLVRCEEALREAGLADRAEVLRCATDAARARASVLPVVLLDVPITCTLEAQLVEALVASSEAVLATVPSGDVRSLGALERALGCSATRLGDDASAPAALARLQASLFEDETRQAPSTLGESVTFVSAPGESRECVEIVRRIQREAERGVPYDRMAVFFRAPGHYGAHLREALFRAGVPAHHARGAVRPDPSGRALLALLACASKGLSARRMAEYLSLGVLPDATDAGAPPEAIPAAERWTPPDDETVPDAIARRDAPPIEPPDRSTETTPVASGSLRSPHRWEAVLVDAAVIGGRDRWERRLAGRRNELLLRQADAQIEDSESSEVRRLEEEIARLDALRAFVLPLVDALAALPERGSWATWCERLGALATRALRDPERVQSVLAELAPMGDIDGITLREVQNVLGPRLSELRSRETAKPAGKVWIGGTDDARGLSFDVVFVPGLAERLFPQKIVEDPIFRDAERAPFIALGASLDDNDARVGRERLALRLAVGAANRAVVLSYPRFDVDQSRPRVPSFYGLEVLRAVEGELPGYAMLARRAERGAAARMGWPAPESPADAIDEAEHDLAVLSEVAGSADGGEGAAHYLLGANAHLARSLRARGRKWRKKWFAVDGLVEPIPEARAALAKHRLGARSYSATALQHYARCPYAFFLQAVMRLRPREVPEPIEELDPMSRGSLVHELQFHTFVALRTAELLPVTPANLDAARAVLEAVLDARAALAEDTLAPAIPRVWADGIAQIRADLREWMRRLADEPWVPSRFELAFGEIGDRERDPASVREPVKLDCGVQLRGSIDLVEQKLGELRATDHKTGKNRTRAGMVLAGGETLQPVLYALALEKLFPGRRVTAGRLSFCTQNGGFSERVVPLDPRARDAASLLASTIDGAIAEAFLPAAPKHDGCKYCDYVAICGPNEEVRTRYKDADKLTALARLRSER